MLDNIFKISVYKAILIIIVSLVFFIPAYARDEINTFYNSQVDPGTYEKLSEMESHFYGHDYSSHILDDRLARLERTLFKYSRMSVGYKLRCQDLYRAYILKKTPFEPKKTRQQLKDNELLLVNFMENRTFGYEKKNMPLNERISQLELAVFGAESQGTLEERFNNLSKKTPLSIKGISVSTNGNVIASFKPDHQTISVPVPPSPHQNNYTPLNITYDNSAGDYYTLIGKNSSGEILRWKDFPLYVYIHSNDPYELSISRAAVENWKNKLPIYETQNYQTADILIDWASKSDYITVPIVTKSNNHKKIKVLINLKDITKTEDKSTLLVFVTHQMGHALGLWGHSDNKDDIMYPSGKLGINDINLKNKFEEKKTNEIILTIKSPKVSTRDFNTLLRVYQTPTSFEKILNSM